MRLMVILISPVLELCFRNKKTTSTHALEKAKPTERFDV